MSGNPREIDSAMDPQRLGAAALAVALLFAAATNYVPAFKDEGGKVFGLFALDVYKDALHVASGLWAAAAAALGRGASRTFLRIFGPVYLVDGIVGVVTGSSFLDLSLLIEGIRPTPVIIKVLSSIPHLLLGTAGILFGWGGQGRAATLRSA